MHLLLVLAVELHTDQVFIKTPPTMQMLHCIQPAEQGGDSEFADGAAVGDFMRKHHPLEFHLLTTIPITFHRKQKQFESIVESPIIRVDPATQRVQQIRHSYFTMAPLKLPFHLTEAFYNAYVLFAQLCNSSLFCYRFSLKSGDFVVYDNYRMLHARTAFSGTRRHLRGIYVDRAQVLKHLRNPATDFAKLPYDKLVLP